MSCPEAAEKWGISERRVQILCSQNRIPGVSKLGYMWLIPTNAEKPIDGRTKQGKERDKKMKQLFLLEDDMSLISGLSFAVKKQGYEIDVARTTLEADTLWENGKYDLAILDVSLPDGSGFDFCKKIRSTSKVPIMFLTAADEETDIIMGLDIGGDDYITKPFKLAIFLSRLNALLRRSENFNTEVTELISNDISIRLLKGEVYKQGKLLELTASEYKLLCFFMENPDQVLSAEQILGKLWDCNENYIDNNSLTVYIRRLRTKIEDNPGEPKRIVTVRGMGYKWNTVD